MDDIGRLRDRVVKLQTHFGQANEDIRQILMSADKIDKRAGKIEELEFDGEGRGGGGDRRGRAAAPQARGGRVRAPCLGCLRRHAPVTRALRVLRNKTCAGAKGVDRGRRDEPDEAMVPIADGMISGCDSQPAEATTAPSARLCRSARGLSQASRADRHVSGFSSGLPLALSGSTLLVWMRESGVDLGTIGLFALVGTPYTLKFLWAPVVDALDVPVLSRLFGRRRGWLVFTQLLLMARSAAGAHRSGEGAAGWWRSAPCWSPRLGHPGHRRRRLPGREPADNEQAAGMASFVAAYRIGMLVSTAGALFLVTGFEGFGFAKIGGVDGRLSRHGRHGGDRHRTALFATEPEKSAWGDRACGPSGVGARVAGRLRGLLGVPHARHGLVGARLRGPVQVLRRLRRHHDGAVRHRSRLLAQRLCHDRQGRRALGLRWSAGLRAGSWRADCPLAASLWLGGPPAGYLQSGVLLARASSASIFGR